MKALLIVVTVGLLAACAGTPESSGPSGTMSDTYFGSADSSGNYNVAMQESLLKAWVRR